MIVISFNLGLNKRTLLNALTVEDIWELVVTNPATVGPGASLTELLETMAADTRTWQVYVVDEQQRLLGVVRITAVTGLLFPIPALAAAQAEPELFRHVKLDGQSVGELMNKKPRFVRLNTKLQHLASALLEENVTELPVVDQADRLIGQVNMYEIIRAYLQFR